MRRDDYDSYSTYDEAADAFASAYRISDAGRAWILTDHPHATLDLINGRRNLSAEALQGQEIPTAF